MMLLCGEALRKMVFIPLCLLLIYFLTYLDLFKQLVNQSYMYKCRSECLIFSETLLKSLLGAMCNCHHILSHFL